MQDAPTQALSPISQLEFEEMFLSSKDFERIKHHIVEQAFRNLVLMPCLNSDALTILETTIGVTNPFGKEPIQYFPMRIVIEDKPLAE